VNGRRQPGTKRPERVGLAVDDRYLPSKGHPTIGVMPQSDQPLWLMPRAGTPATIEVSPSGLAPHWVTSPGEGDDHRGPAHGAAPRVTFWRQL